MNSQFRKKNERESLLKPYPIYTAEHKEGKDSNPKKQEDKSVSYFCSDLCYTLFPIPIQTYPLKYSYVHNSHTIIDTCSGRISLWKINSSRAIRYSASTFDTCMAPIYCYNRCSYRICCCDPSTGNYSCCCSYLICGLPWMFVKSPFYILSGACAATAGMIGAIQDQQTPRLEIDEGPGQQYMDDPEEQIDRWINTRNLVAIVQFANKGTKYLNALTTYKNNIGLRVLCLAISYVNDDIEFNIRKKLVSNLLKRGVSINGFRTQTNMLIPLHEALISQQDHAKEMLDFLCSYGVDTEITLPYLWKGEWLDVNPLIWLYYFYIDKHLNIENAIHKAVFMIMNSSSLLSILNQPIVDDELKDISQSTKDCIEAKNIFKTVEIELKGKKLNNDLIHIIGSYSGAFFAKTTKPLSDDEIKTVPRQQVTNVYPAEFKRGQFSFWELPFSYIQHQLELNRLEETRRKIREFIIEARYPVSDFVMA